jgi:hypothetical protein
MCGRPVKLPEKKLANFFHRLYRLYADYLSLRSAALSQKIDLIDPSLKPKDLASSHDEAEVVRRILRSLAGLEYGSVEIIVQDSKVVQIERTQRSRFSQPLEIPRA